MSATENDELEKIMSEIEELQKELAPEDHSGPSVEMVQSTAARTPAAKEGPAVVLKNSPEVEEDILREIQSGAAGHSADTGLEDTLAEIKAEATKGGLLDEETSEEVAMPKASDTGQDGTLSLTLTGNMTLKLKYDFEGQEVTISFVDQALCVQMTDGTEFKVPVHRGASNGHAGNVKPFKKAV